MRHQKFSLNFMGAAIGWRKAAKQRERRGRLREARGYLPAYARVQHVALEHPTQCLPPAAARARLLARRATRREPASEPPALSSHACNYRQ